MTELRLNSVTGTASGEIAWSRRELKGVEDPVEWSGRYWWELVLRGQELTGPLSFLPLGCSELLDTMDYAKSLSQRLAVPVSK